MKHLLPLLFAFIAAAGNALFAYGQKKSAGMSNGLLYVSSCALVACILALLASPAVGPVQLASIRQNWLLVIISGAGLFLTYLGFNLLYSHFGVAQYVLYAVISIITTTVIVGRFVLGEPLNHYHLAAIAAALVTVSLFSFAQSKA